jgi:hypothetical protein
MGDLPPREDNIMKTKVLAFLLTSSLVALAAWRVHRNAVRDNGANGFTPYPDPVFLNQVPEKYRETVRKGLEYLVKNQFEDGHWEGGDGKHPVAMTGLVGLALFMEGNSDHTGKYSVNIRKAVDWLTDKSHAERGGLIFSEHPSETGCYMQGHGLATLSGRRMHRRARQRTQEKTYRRSHPRGPIHRQSPVYPGRLAPHVQDGGP